MAKHEFYTGFPDSCMSIFCLLFIKYVLVSFYFLQGGGGADMVCIHKFKHIQEIQAWRMVQRDVINKYYQGARNLPSHGGSQWNHWCHQCQVGRLLLSVAGLFFFLGGGWRWTKIHRTYECRLAEKKHCDLCFTNCFTRICCQQILRNHRVFFCLCSACSLAFWCGQTFLGRSRQKAHTWLHGQLFF